MTVQSIFSHSTGEKLLDSVRDSITQHYTLFFRYGDGLGRFYDYFWSMHSPSSIQLELSIYNEYFPDQFPDYPIWITEYASTSNDDAGEFSDVVVTSHSAG